MDYQKLTGTFKPGDAVSPNPSLSDPGTVVSVWPAIGRVDVSFGGLVRSFTPDMLYRLPEPLSTSQFDLDNPGYPGGRTYPSVSAGSTPQSRVASRWFRTAIYWAEKGRKYKPTQSEIDTGRFKCPKCESGILRKVVYKHEEDGRRVKLFCCPKCLFLIRRDDVLRGEDL